MRKCVVCGTEYEYCPNCPKHRQQAAWHKLFHEENCKKIFNILNDYHFKHIDINEARELLSQCDLSHMHDFNAHYRNEIETIMAKPKHRGYRAKLSLVDEVMEAPVAEEVPVVEIIEEELPLA